MIYFVSSFFIMVAQSVRRFVITLVFGLMAASARAADDHPIFHSTDPLAPRDEWGVLHQTPTLYPTDFARRSGSRWYFYFKSRHELLADPAYVGALQVVLRSRGYYCGPIDGMMSDEISTALARVQKNHNQRVTGTLTVPVRRALHLP